MKLLQTSLLCSSALTQSLTFRPQLKSTAFGLVVGTLLSAHMSMAAPSAPSMEYDIEYPGTAVERLKSVHTRVQSLKQGDLSRDWESVRRNILWAGGLKDLSDSVPGQGYTGHSFNDFNHCDLTTMLGANADNENEGRVEGIHRSNQLGSGIRIASIEELGPGGSWSTCMIGSNTEPPRDVAHLQFQSRIAFKLVWAPPLYSSFVLVDDGGALLAKGTPTGSLPHIAERKRNYQTVMGSKYAVEADKLNAKSDELRAK